MQCGRQQFDMLSASEMDSADEFRADREAIPLDQEDPPPRRDRFPVDPQGRSRVTADAHPAVIAKADQGTPRGDPGDAAQLRGEWRPFIGTDQNRLSGLE